MVKIDIEKQIAKELILAQIASDGGKLNKELRHITKKSYVTWQKGYKAKNRHILNAIMLINKSKGKSAFKYSVINNSDQSIGVIFEYNNMYQLSFHTFDKKIAKFSYHKPNKKFVKIKIDEFSSSRYIAVKLANIFNIGKLHNWL